MPRPNVGPSFLRCALWLRLPRPHPIVRSPVPLPMIHRSLGQTSRRDAWWIWPVLVFLGLGTFVVYSTWAAFQGTHYHFGPYLSPFYSPELWGDSPHSWFGPKPALVACVAAVFAGAVDPVGAGRVSA